MPKKLTINNGTETRTIAIESDAGAYLAGLNKIDKIADGDRNDEHRQARLDMLVRGKAELNGYTLQLEDDDNA